MVAALFFVSTAGQGFALEMTTLAIGTAKDPNLGTELVIAREKGFFKAVGLEVELKYFPSGGDLSAAIVGGSLAMGSSGSTPTTTLRGAPFPIKILAQMSDISGAQQIIVKSDIRRPEDLYGKRIGMLKGTSSEIMVDSLAKAYGVDLGKIERVSMGPTEMLSSFVRGDLPAVSLWEPHSTRARKGGNGRILVSGTTSYIAGREGPNRIYGDHSTLFATEDFIRKNPKTVRAVLEALARAVEYVEKDPEGANAILAKEFGMPTEDMRDIMKVNRYQMVIDQVMVDDLNRIADFLFSLGKLKGKQAVVEWIDTAPLRDVRPEWVKVK
ncbi:MAG TPA: ABC transporter substrate-binding protein [Candidatus Polarisedimenticolia bacterium]|nr:ABC transporter substrate-binding protein [Candidatus Polarisedimenticolia bacterium]